MISAIGKHTLTHTITGVSMLPREVLFYNVPCNMRTTFTPPKAQLVWVCVSVLQADSGLLHFPVPNK